MFLSADSLIQNASILQQVLCSSSSDWSNRVYVDKNKNFQVDGRNSFFFRFRFFRWLFPLGQTAHEIIGDVAIRTLRRVSDALEDPASQEKQRIRQVYAQGEQTWMDRVEFGWAIVGAPCFACKPCKNVKGQLSSKVIINTRVMHLAQMIMQGRDVYMQTNRTCDYQNWS